MIKKRLNIDSLKYGIFIVFVLIILGVVLLSKLPTLYALGIPILLILGLVIRLKYKKAKLVR